MLSARLLKAGANRSKDETGLDALALATVRTITEEQRTSY